MRILVTGAAGFIGFHLARRLLARGEVVIGLDNLNPYYDVRLKEDRLAQLAAHAVFEFHRLDLADRAGMEDLFATAKIERVVHLAAQAGVRHSIDHPHDYVESNLTGFLHVLEGCRRARVEHLVYASSSSVYGANTKLPYSPHDRVDHPVSLYSATKRANELMAHSYSHLYRIPTTGLRFFTVYGPWGRPDMALFSFTAAILAGRPIELFNAGQMRRDLTYIDDAVEAVARVLDRPATPAVDWNSAAPDPATSHAPFRLYNVGNRHPIELPEIVATLEANLGRQAIVKLAPAAAGDVMATCADVESLATDLGYRPGTPFAEGVRRFVEWYVEYYRDGIGRRES
ncbi:MAG: NAD-dependent epimerase [Pirellulales bacterium]|nr:NAD-dependent epimerase [Pirellulales bacterium]